MARGVSAANVVATMDVPTIHQGNVLPDKKYSSVLEPARLEKYTPTPMENSRYASIMAQSIQWSVVASIINFY